jgi:hypothetical protein
VFTHETHRFNAAFQQKRISIDTFGQSPRSKGRWIKRIFYALFFRRSRGTMDAWTFPESENTASTAKT